MAGWEDKVVEHRVTPWKLRGFEKVSKYANVDIPKPCRKTEWSAGYDMTAAHDVVVQPLGAILNKLLYEIQQERIDDYDRNELEKLSKQGSADFAATIYEQLMTLNLDEIKAIMKKNKLQPTLVSTGYKAYMMPNEKVDLSVRSSTPLNAFIILANPPGLIDSDYYNNPDNEGEIFFQIINLSPVPIHIRKGDTLGQAVFNNYLITDDDADQPKQPRKGGFGHTSEKK